MPCAHACKGWCACGLAPTSRNSHAKEGSEPLQGAPANGCMLARVHGVQCVPSSYVRTVVVKYLSKNSRGKEVARAAGWAGWTCRTMWSGNGSSQDRRWRGPHVWGLGRLSVWASEVSQLIVNGRGYAVIEGDGRFVPSRVKRSPSLGRVWT
jgi:hypothetical protein